MIYWFETDTIWLASLFSFYFLFVCWIQLVSFSLYSAHRNHALVRPLLLRLIELCIYIEQCDLLDYQVRNVVMASFFSVQCQRVRRVFGRAFPSCGVILKSAQVIRDKSRNYEHNSQRWGIYNCSYSPKSRDQVRWRMALTTLKSAHPRKPIHTSHALHSKVWS